jgi:hypothetical protein
LVEASGFQDDDMTRIFLLYFRQIPAHNN